MRDHGETVINVRTACRVECSLYWIVEWPLAEFAIMGNYFCLLRLLHQVSRGEKGPHGRRCGLLFYVGSLQGEGELCFGHDGIADFRGPAPLADRPFHPGELDLQGQGVARFHLPAKTAFVDPGE